MVAGQNREYADWFEVLFSQFDSNEYFKQHLCCYYFAKKCNAVEIDKIFSKIVSFYLRVITDYPINLNYGKT